MKNVKDFGAVGDGVADDTAAIQAAYAAEPSLYFPEGHYLLRAPIQGVEVYVTGDGPDSVIVFDNAYEYAFECTVDGGFRDFTLLNGGIQIPGSPVDQYVHMANITIDSAWIGVNVTAGSVDNVGHLYLDLYRVTIRDSRNIGLTFFGEGVKTLNAQDCLFEGSVASHLLYLHSHVNAILSSCVFQGAGDFALQFQGGKASTIAPKYRIVRNCVFEEDNSRGAVTSGLGPAQFLGCHFLGKSTILVRSETEVDGCSFVSSESQRSMIGVVPTNTPYGLYVTNSTFRDKAPANFRPIIEARRGSGSTVVDGSRFVSEGNGNGYLAADSHYTFSNNECTSKGFNVGVYAEGTFGRVRANTFTGNWIPGQGCLVFGKSGQVCELWDNLWKDSNSGPIVRATQDVVILHGKNSSHNSSTPITVDDPSITWETF